jgi:hypothetical protein
MKRTLLTSAWVRLCTVTAMCALVWAQQPPRQQATIGPVSQIHPADPARALPTGETYVYQAEWRLWNAGSAKISLEKVGEETRVSGAADSAGVVALLYPVHDRFQSAFDSRTFCSHTLTKHTEEGFHKRDTLIGFNYTRRRSVLDETNLKNAETKHQENDIPGCVTDVLSAIFYVGSLPLLADATYTFPLNDGGKTVDVSAHVEGREQVKVPAGTFNTVRVAPSASAGVLKERGKIWIWYSDDNRRVPVQMRARMFWGTLTFQLIRIEKK